METKFTKGEKQLRLSKWFAWYPVNTNKGFEWVFAPKRTKSKQALNKATKLNK